MPPVYLDSIKLEEDCTRLVVNAMGSLSETCSKCGGSLLHVRSIFLHSREDSAVIWTWCNTCGNYARLTQEYPASWRRRILKKVGSPDRFLGSR
jgi:5-methylcytosine-specific restriction endonuclease McrA